jgi:glycosyltransferase involved in cell wall biosynthesis
MQQISVIIPAYNEEAGIEPVLTELLKTMKSSGLEYEVIVVDDGSADATAAIAERCGVRVVAHEQNQGYGASLKTGIRAARFDAIAITDADGTYPNDRLPELARLLDDYDMVVGSRTGASVKIPLVRRPAKWFLNKYANYLSNYKIPDLNSGLRIFRRKAVEEFIRLLPSGFSFTTTITLAFLCNNYRVKFIPIDYYKRSGKSKIRPIHDVLNFFALITRTSLYFNPLRVFMPISAVFLTGAAGYLIYTLIHEQNITDTSVVLFLFGIQIGVLGLIADMVARRL